MAKTIIKLELLAPAKDLNSAKIAVLAGADAVYIGGPKFSARFAAGNSWQDIEDIIMFAHQYYVKVYLPINTIFFDNETVSVKEMIDKAYEIGVDALIIQDMGIITPLVFSSSTRAVFCDCRFLRLGRHTPRRRPSQPGPRFLPQSRLEVREPVLRFGGLS